jgi:hypothetical protein
MKMPSTVTSMLLPLVVVAGAVLGPRSSQDVPTHVLELTAGDAPEPVRGDAWLAVEGNCAITVAMPDGEQLTVECVVTEIGEIKFQWSRIGGDRIASVQFVGTGSFEGGFEGNFTAMVDGERRPDMSGVFALVPQG